MSRAQRKSVFTAVIACAVLFVFCDGSESAAQQERQTQGDRLADYRLDNHDWNGLAEFEQIAFDSGWRWHESQDAGIESGVETSLDPDGILMLVYPTEPLDISSILRWVEQGGQLLLCDDFGSSEPLLRALGLTRHLPVREATGSALHVLREAGDHPISRGVASVVTNHPAAFRNEKTGLFPFADSSYLLYDLTLGRGRVVAVSDPSVLINAMLSAGDNRQLARNISRTLCDRATCSASLLTGSEASVAIRAGLLDAGRTRPELSPDWQADVEAAVSSFSELTLDATGTRIVILVLALLSGFLLLSGFAFNRQRTVMRSPTRSNVGGQRQRLVRQLAQQRYGEGRSQVSIRIVSLLSQVFSDELRQEFRVHAGRDSEVWEASLSMVSDQRRPLLESIVQRLRSYNLSDESAQDADERPAQSRGRQVDAKELQELLTAMQRWNAIRQIDGRVGP